MLRQSIKNCQSGLPSRVEPDSEFKREFDKIKDREINIQSKISKIKAELESIPAPEYVKRLSELEHKVLHDATKHMKPERIVEKPYEWKRNLIKNDFSRTDVRGRR